MIEHKQRSIASRLWSTSLQSRYGLLLLVLAALLLTIQCTSLFVFPEPNSLRWFGDETWLMSEAASQISTGLVRYPIAIGSSLQYSKGLVLSMPWLSSVLYGFPLLLTSYDPIAVGRIVTCILSVVLCLALFKWARNLESTPLAASCAVLLLVCSRSFFFSSHSCRTDIMAGLITLVFVGYNIQMLRTPQARSNRWFFCYGAILAFLSVSSSIHLVTLLLPVSIYFLWYLTFNNRLKLFTAILGGVVAGGALALIYFASTGQTSLFTQSSGRGQFSDVLSAIPILRPFSRSVQISNILTRAHQFLLEAPQIFLLPVVMLIRISERSRRASTVTSRHLLIATAIVFFSWMLLEGGEINYLVHILPLLWILFAVTVSNIRYSSVGIAAAILAMGFTVFAFRDAVAARLQGVAVDRSNARATEQITRDIALDQQGNSAPLVLTETPMLARLANSASLHVMTDHFLSFPLQNLPVDSFLKVQHVNYVVLYNSPVYPKNRYVNDPFYQQIRSSCIPIDSIVGMSGDMGRDYFHPTRFNDTVFLFRVNYAR